MCRLYIRSEDNGCIGVIILRSIVWKFLKRIKGYEYKRALLNDPPKMVHRSTNRIYSNISA